jgi:hypothetical protein
MKLGASALLAVASLAVSGCGGSSATHTTRLLPQVPKSIPSPKATGKPASPAAVQVIKNWSRALGQGNIRAAARSFQVPSELINGGDAGTQVAVIPIHNLHQAEVANQSLPCGAQFISADQRGRYVNVLFRLTGRPGPGGSPCQPGAGQTARTNFIIAGGHIVEWIRAPSDPGDNATPGGPSV